MDNSHWKQTMEWILSKNDFKYSSSIIFNEKNIIQTKNMLVKSYGDTKPSILMIKK